MFEVDLRHAPFQRVGNDIAGMRVRAQWCLPDETRRYGYECDYPCHHSSFVLLARHLVRAKGNNAIALPHALRDRDVLVIAFAGFHGAEEIGLRITLHVYV